MDTQTSDRIGVLLVRMKTDCYQLNVAQCWRMSEMGYSQLTVWLPAYSTVLAAGWYKEIWDSLPSAPPPGMGLVFIEDLREMHGCELPILDVIDESLIRQVELINIKNKFVPTAGRWVWMTVRWGLGVSEWEAKGKRA